MKSGIYRIYEIDTQLSYIGQSHDALQRVKDHFRGKNCKQHYIDRVIRKRGRGAFAFEILELCEEDNLNQREIHWIASVGCVAPNGFNLTYGGKSGRHSEETCKKKSKSGRGKSPSADTRRKISNTLKDRTPSAEHRLNLSKSLKKHHARYRYNPKQLQLF